MRRGHGMKEPLWYADYWPQHWHRDQTHRDLFALDDRDVGVTVPTTVGMSRVAPRRTPVASSKNLTERGIVLPRKI